MRCSDASVPFALRSRELARFAPPCSLFALAVILLGCDGSPPGSPGGAARPAEASGLRALHDSVAAIPETQVQGQLRGAPFVVRDARYVIDRREGHEHVDLLLADAASAVPCGVLEPAEPARLWLRRPGAELPRSGETRIVPTAVVGGPDASAREARWQAHYETMEQGKWVGHGTAAALVELELHDASLELAGAISVCFADGRASCAAGRFVARYCPSALDRPLRGVGPTESPASAPLRPAAASSNAR